MILSSRVDDAVLAIRYTLSAQFTPLNHKDWDSHKEGISSFRGSSQIYVFRPKFICPKVNLKFKLQNNIGGFLGIGTTESISDIIFDRN